MKLPPCTQNAVCQAGRPRRLSKATTSICAWPTLSTPNFTSYSMRSPGPNGTLARLTLAATTVGVAGVCARDSTDTSAATDANPTINRLTLHLLAPPEDALSG